jgi:hypothetical protein
MFMFASLLDMNRVGAPIDPLLVGGALKTQIGPTDFRGKSTNFLDQGILRIQANRLAPVDRALILAEKEVSNIVERMSLV